MRRILAIDPGREKCGFALLEENQVMDRGIVSTPELQDFLKKRLAQWNPQVVLLGDGTFSKEVKKQILPDLNGIPLQIVDEHDSTYRARKLYFEQNPPRGFWRFIPLGLQVPPEPYDDFAAMLLAIRYYEAREIPRV